ncbi:MAG TPA: hypothetical protein DC054_08955 [Blastocatellia bacterium]|nr:hypothetical protein [Blastocatellia bacterium]
MFFGLLSTARRVAASIGLSVAVFGSSAVDVFAADSNGLLRNADLDAIIGAADVRGQGKEADRKPGAVEKENLKQQAVLVIHRIIDRAQEISDVEVRTSVISNALALLWNYDEQYAVSSFQQNIDRLLEKYSADDATPAERLKLAAAIRQLVTAVAPRNQAQADQALERYKKTTGEGAGDEKRGLSPKERLSIAQANLDFDVKQSAALAEAILRLGVPSMFPDYLSQLEDRNPDLSNSLYRVGLSQLISNPIYSPVHATILSAYVFREKLLLIEIRTNSAASPAPQFGSLTTNLNPEQLTVDRELAAEYLTAAEAFLRQRLVALHGQTTLNPEYVVQCYSLAVKLNAYASRLSLARDDRWRQLSVQFDLLAHRAGVTSEDLSNIALLAERLATEETFFKSDDGASSFERAKASKEDAERTELLVRGIHELVEAQKYSEAERKLVEIKDEEIKVKVTDYLNFRAGKVAVSKRKWIDLSTYLARIADARFRTYLLLEGMDAAFKSKKKDLASKYLQNLADLISTIDNKSDKAKALVAMSGVLSSNESEESSQAVLDAIRAINQADDYDGGDYSVTVDLPKLSLSFRLKNSNIATSLQNFSKIDWDRSINATNTINRVEIRAMAQIAACRAVL